MVTLSGDKIKHIVFSFFLPSNEIASLPLIYPAKILIG